MKKLLLSSLFAFFSTAQAEQLKNYDSIVAAVHNGLGIRYVVDWDLCKTSVPEIPAEFSSSYTPDNVIISKKGVLASRGMAYTHEIHQMPGLGPVNQAYVYMLHSNDVLKVINRFLDPVTNTEKMKAVEATCILGEGAKVFTVG
ncbi:hypothetical protein [Legionella worsleiensis]|uniref:VirK protein n=1 Tax=Legionella worsleiensis TaxID=45076 RepID=A0A0W1AJK4_9GAMM|nr:hypothetical protein [Legionella worsleiensis]KTD81422.1 VirK protein [Legionella worsleiensis]STY30111.1 Uncharacterised protein [Legionella worsleiensis]